MICINKNIREKIVVVIEMLMRFSVSNFMSFRYKEDSQGNILPEEFHLYAGRSEQFRDRVLDFENRKILKFASVYGANAAGKTNLIRAVDCGRNIVISTMENADYRDKYCKNKNENREKPTFFEYEFTVGKKCYAYGFTVNLESGNVLSEWLYALSEKEETAVFERQVQQNKYYFDEKIFRNSENVQQFHYFIQDANRIKGSLLLYEINRRNLEDKDFEIFSRIYNWFRYKLVVIYPDTKMGASYFLFENDNSRLIGILDYFDTGITGYEMKKINENTFREYFADDLLAEKFLKVPERKGYRRAKRIINYGGTLFELNYYEGKTEKIEKLMFQHGTDEARYEYGEESDGTKRLIELLGVILNDDEDRVFLIDELDRSLHPQMTIKFVETFLKFSLKRNTQLVITTHESNLMDLKVLRRDEIWFAEREKDNTTTLYTLDKFKIRCDKVVNKDYLAGRYGAVPVFKDFEYVWGGNVSGETESEKAENI